MKPTVHYTNCLGILEIGQSAIITPVDHPDSANVSNKKYALTSQIVSIGEDGEFETVNTSYKLIKDAS